MIITTTLAALTFLFGSVPPTEPAPLPIPADYVPLIDSTESIVIATPATWADLDIAPVPLEDGSEAPYIAASTDLTAFYEEFSVPGVIFVGFPLTDDLLGLVDRFGNRGCAVTEVKEYSDPFFLGVIQIGTDCGPGHLTWNMVVANHLGEPKFTALVQVQSANVTELETVLRTFNVGPNAAAVFIAPPPTTAAPTTAAPTTVAPTTTTAG